SSIMTTDTVSILVIINYYFLFSFICQYLFYLFFFFFFNDTATTEIYTLSLHDALPIYRAQPRQGGVPGQPDRGRLTRSVSSAHRSEEHTSELQSRSDLVCRLLLEKKKKKKKTPK